MRECHDDKEESSEHQVAEPLVTFPRASATFFPPAIDDRVHLEDFQAHEQVYALHLIRREASQVEKDGQSGDHVEHKPRTQVPAGQSPHDALRGHRQKRTEPVRGLASGDAPFGNITMPGHNLVSERVDVRRDECERHIEDVCGIRTKPE
eukprot:3536765-Prymnesium_polylepis.1